MEHLSQDARWTVGSALPWDEATADAVLRTRLRVTGRPQAPNLYGLVGVGFALVVLPSSPTGEEIPIATTACVLNLN